MMFLRVVRKIIVVGVMFSLGCSSDNTDNTEEQSDNSEQKMESPDSLADSIPELQPDLDNDMGDVVDSDTEATLKVPQKKPSLPSPVTATLGVKGGELTTGKYSAKIPALEKNIEVTLTPMGEDDIRSPKPLSVPLAIAEITPFNHPLKGMMELIFPINRPVPAGTSVELLAFSRSMDAFWVIGSAKVTSEGTVKFSSNFFSQYVVIAKPELQTTSCEGDNFKVHQKIPNRSEESVTGLVEKTDRMTREDAFKVMSDMRLFPRADMILFKDEERKKSRKKGKFKEEDFLVDPRLADPLITLGEIVLEQWVDPIGGGPAFQLRVTDSYDSMIEHSKRSNHYRGKALDLTLSPVPASTPDARKKKYGKLSRLAFCAGFEYVHFENKFHIHVSSRSTRIAYVETSEEGRSLILSDLDGKRRVSLSRNAPISMDDIEVQNLSFDSDGNFLELKGRQGGQPVFYRFNLTDNTVRKVQVEEPDLGVFSKPFIIIDPSLRVDAGSCGISIQRHIDSEQNPDNKTLDLTPLEKCGWTPTIWR